MSDFTGSVEYLLEKGVWGFEKNSASITQIRLKFKIRECPSVFIYFKLFINVKNKDKLQNNDAILYNLLLCGSRFYFYIATMP